ncbi:hypothetical protein [uncultured Muribaculum sp.]|uniref:hypothetical protein n=1 Tax=uncultured Muribaculum sp. TaxID=1918613 RepID=UPI0026761B52|nr:hypothetical protein [uncultured Muribaculum sp.]
MNTFQKFLTLTVLFASFFSCSTDEDTLIEDPVKSRASGSDFSIEIMRPDFAIKKFAAIFSKVVYTRQDVREFIKAEASKRFDGNTDILYGEVKDVIINGTSFRDILIAESSLKEISDIERSVPELNIFVPEMIMFDVTVDNMDCTDSEIPVGVANEDGMDLYLNGKVEVSIPMGELPDFHSFVVNGNNLVQVHMDTDSAYSHYTLLCPNNNEVNGPQKSIASKGYEVGSKAIESFKYFYKDDVCPNSRNLQRDYIYYGITPRNGTGIINYGVAEYLSFMEVDPAAYFSISDEYTGEKNNLYEDPRIIKNSVSRKKKDFTEEELIAQMWSQGTYTFRFEVLSSANSMPTVAVINLTPEKLWNFNLDRKYRHSTMFRHSKYTYRIDPKKFTAKRVKLYDREIMLGKWDLAIEALEKYISIFEEDKGTQYEYTNTYEVTRLSSIMVNGSLKYGLGTNFDRSVNPSIEIGTTNSTTIKETKTSTVRRSEKDDALGTIKVYFYDPIVLEKTDTGYVVQSYNTGVVNFGLMVK